MAIIDRGKLLASGSPADAEAALAGKVWSRTMSKQELQQRDWSYPILSTKLVAGLPLVRVYSEVEPVGSWRLVEPDLEDVFFAKLSELR
jgi:hypothetical protein